MTDLYFCETGAQANVACRKCAFTRKKSIFVSAYPSSTFWFEENSVDYLDIEDVEPFHSKDEMAELLKKQVQWALNVDNFLQSEYPDIDSEFKPTIYFINFFKAMWDTIIHHSEIVEQIISQNEPETFYYFPDIHPRKISNELLLNGSYYAPIITHLCSIRSIKTELVPLSEKTQKTISSDSSLQIHWQIRRLVQSQLFRFIYLYKTLSLNGSNSLQKTLLIQRSYEFTPDVCRSLEQLGYTIINFDALPLKDDIRENFRITDTIAQNVWENISRQHWFYENLGWNDTDFSSVFKPFFHHYITRVIPIIWENREQSNQILEKIKPRAIGYGVWGPRDIGLLMAGKEKKIPRIMFQHGGSIGDVENLGVVYNDHFLSDFELVYGVGHQEYIDANQWFTGYKTITSAVGDARLEWIRARLTPENILSVKKKMRSSPRKKIILYVPGAIMTNFFRYSCHNIRNNYTFAIRKSVFDLFENHSESIQFIYKPMITPYDDPTCELINRHYPAVRVVRDIPLPELQAASDLIIQEVPSSGMYETMITNRPMIVLVDKHIWQISDENIQLLGKRAHVARDNNEFISMIQKAINNPEEWIKPNSDKDFFRRYCVPEDGRSAQRASEKIDQIIKSWKYM